MASKKLPQNIDLASNLEVAAGFFSNSSNSASDQKRDASPSEKPKASKNPGGRPPKTGLKNEQFTLTMPPENFEKIRILAKQYADGNISRLISIAVESFCMEKDIDFSAMTVDPEIIERYKQKQEKRKKTKY